MRWQCQGPMTPADFDILFFEAPPPFYFRAPTCATISKVLLYQITDARPKLSLCYVNYEKSKKALSLSIMENTKICNKCSYIDIFNHYFI